MVVENFGISKNADVGGGIRSSMLDSASVWWGLFGSRISRARDIGWQFVRQYWMGAIKSKVGRRRADGEG